MNRNLITVALPFVVFWSMCSVSAGINGGLANSLWPDYGGGNSNSHLSPGLGPSQPVQILWTYNVPAGSTRANNQPVIGSDNTIYFTTISNFTQGHLVALNPDGSLKWDVSDPPASLGNWPAVTADGKVVVARMHATVTNYSIKAFSQATGAQLWSTATSFDAGPSGPTVDLNGNIYSKLNGNYLLSLAPNGAQNWQVGGGQSGENPSVTSNGLILATVGETVNAFNPNGTIAWSYEGPYLNIFNSPSIDSRGNIFTADMIYRDMISLTPSGAYRWGRSNLGGAVSIGPDDTTYAFEQSVLHAMDPDTGADRWTYNVGPMSQNTLEEGVTIDAQGKIYVANSDGIVTALSSQGTLLWTFDLAPTINGSINPGAPVIGPGGVLYVPGGSTGKFFALFVPEPATCATALVGLAGVAMSRRRKPGSHRKASRSV
jgi:outer membrane protein assembly factor BamB